MLEESRFVEKQEYISIEFDCSRLVYQTSKRVWTILRSDCEFNKVLVVSDRRK